VRRSLRAIQAIALAQTPPFAGARVWDRDDVFFDGLDIDAPSCVGHSESAPDLRASVGLPHSEPLALWTRGALTDEEVEGGIPAGATF
jgi:hypothetical protein